MKKLSGEDEARLIAGLYKTAFPRYVEDIPNILCMDFESALDSMDESYIRGLLTSIGFSILSGNPVDEPYREFIGEALISIGHEKLDANKAFKLKSGHRKKNSKIRGGRITLLVLWLIYIKKQSDDSAFRAIGNRKDVALSWERVRDIYEEYKDEVVGQLIDL